MARMLSPRWRAALDAYVAYDPAAPAVAPAVAAPAVAVAQQTPAITHAWIRDASIDNLRDQISTQGIDISSSGKTLKAITKKDAHFCVTMHYFPGGPVAAANTHVAQAWSHKQYLLCFFILISCAFFQFVLFAALSEVLSVSKIDEENHRSSIWDTDDEDKDKNQMPIMFLISWALFCLVSGEFNSEIMFYRVLFCYADFCQFRSFFDWRVWFTLPLLATTSRIITESHPFYKRIVMFLVKFVVKWIWATPFSSSNGVREMVVLGLIYNLRPGVTWVSAHQKWFALLFRDFENTANFLISGKTMGNNLSRDEYKEYGAMLGISGTSFSSGACTLEEKTDLENARKKLCGNFIAIVTCCHYMRTFVGL